MRSMPYASPGRFCPSTSIDCADHVRTDREWRCASLVVAREQMTCERTRAVNALTALVRTVELGVDARKSLAYSQIREIATWRSRSEDATAATCRAEAVRLAKRIRALDAELVDNRKSLDALAATNAPERHCRGRGRRGGCSDRPDRVVTCRSGALRGRVRLTRRDLPGPGFIW